MIDAVIWPTPLVIGELITGFLIERSDSIKPADEYLAYSKVSLSDQEL